MSYITNPALDKDTKSVRVSEVNQEGSQPIYEELVDTTNLAAATYYYPSSDGRTRGKFNYVSIHGETSGGVTVTFEGKNDDSTDWKDITPAGYRLDDNSNGNASFVDQSFIVDFDGLRVRNFRIKVVTADATNGVQLHWGLSVL